MRAHAHTSARTHSAGVPARVTAINAALREFRPGTLHVFNVSTVRSGG